MERISSSCGADTSAFGGIAVRALEVDLDDDGPQLASAYLHRMAIHGAGFVTAAVRPRDIMGAGVVDRLPRDQNQAVV